MMNHDEVVLRWVTRAIAKCPRIPADRDKRAHKVAGYMRTEMEREKNPDRVAQTIQDLQEQVQDTQRELAQRKQRANE